MASADLTDAFLVTSAVSKTRFLLLVNIVEKLQQRFFNGDIDAITLDDLIKESGLIIHTSDRNWLASQALLSNERIQVTKVNNMNRFVYKPPLDLKAPTKKHLLNLIKWRHENCEGAVTVDDVRDTISVEKADIIIDNLIKSGEVIKVKSNRKEILLYTDHGYDLHADTEFIQSWREISVEGLDDEKIGDFLDDHGHFALAKDYTTK